MEFVFQKRFKKKKRKWKPLLYSGTVRGRIPSKKNSRRLGVNRRTGRPFSIPSKAYETNKPLFISQLLDTWEGKMITEPCQLRLRVYEHNEDWFKKYPYPIQTEW